MMPKFPGVSASSLPTAPLRVLMINTEHGWRGGERVLELILGHLPAGIAITTVCQPGSALAQRFSTHGYRIHPLAMRSALNISTLSSLRRLGCAHDVVHAQTSHAHGLAVLALAGTGIPVLVTRHLDFPIGFFSKWKYRAADHFAAVSGRVGETLAAAGVAPQRITVIRNGVEISDADRDGGGRQELRTQLGIPSEAIVAMSVGQLTEQKDPHLLLDAWATATQDLAKAWLVLVGTGDLEASLRARAVPRVVFAGFRNDVTALLRMADLFVLASRNEGLPLAVCEALVAGLPVVATRAGGTPEVVHDGGDGLLVAIGDRAGLTSALRRLLTDESERRSFGHAARTRAARELGAGSMANAYAALYRRLLKVRP